MNNYLEQFKKLPRELQEMISSEEKVKNLEEIEAKFGLKLAKLVVRLMIKDISWINLEKFCQENFKLTSERASELKKDLVEKILKEAMDYLAPEAKVEELRVKKSETETISSVETLTKIGSDELELERVAGEVKAAWPMATPLPPSPLKSLEEIVKEVKIKTGLSFADEILERRFENIALNFLKEIRKDFETEEILSRSEKIAGLGLSEEKASEIVKILKEEKEKFIEMSRNIQSPAGLREIKPELAEGILAPQEIVAPVSRIEELPIEEPLKEIKKLEVEKTAEKPEETLEIDTDLKQRFDGGSLTPSFKSLEKLEEGFKEEIKKEKQAEPLLFTEKQEETPREPEVISLSIKRPISGEKLRVEDISSSHPRALGPVEELQEIDLTDFRRWGQPQEVKQLILNKINLLAEESVLKKDQGVKAWQRSPLYKLYVGIGLEALEKEKSVEEIIRQRTVENKETLSLEEFETISELNQKLRF